MDILKVYKTRCREEFKQYGFKSYSQNHYRVINDVFQSFLLQKSVSGHECVVLFGVTPLCDLIPEHRKRTCGAQYELRNFEGKVGWWTYDRHSEESIKKCVEDLIAYMKKYLIPFFERGNDCEGAYQERLRINEIMRKSYNNNNDGLGGYRLYFMLLKIGDYDGVIEYLKNDVKRYQDSIEDKFADHISSDEEKEELKIKIAETEEQIRLISDHDYVKNFIETNEQKSLENLLTPKELEKWKKANGKD